MLLFKLFWIGILLFGDIQFVHKTIPHTIIINSDIKIVNILSLSKQFILYPQKISWS